MDKPHRGVGATGAFLQAASQPSNLVPYKLKSSTASARVQHVSFHHYAQETLCLLAATMDCAAPPRRKLQVLWEDKTVRRNW